MVLVGSSVVGMSATVRNTNVRNHLRTVRRNALLHPPFHNALRPQTPTTDTQSLNKCLHSRQGKEERWGEFEQARCWKPDGNTQGVGPLSDLGNSAIWFDPNSPQSPFLRILRIG